MPFSRAAAATFVETPSGIGTARPAGPRQCPASPPDAPAPAPAPASEDQQPQALPARPPSEPGLRAWGVLPVFPSPLAGEGGPRRGSGEGSRAPPIGAAQAYPERLRRPLIRLAARATFS